MGCLKYLSQEEIEKLVSYVARSKTEVSICIPAKGKKIVEKGSESSVERAGMYPQCACIVHFHPEGEPSKVYFSSMPSARDIAIVIHNAVDLLAQNLDPCQYEDMIVFNTGYIIYSISDMNKLKAFLSKLSDLSFSTIDQTLKSIFKKIVRLVMQKYEINMDYISEREKNLLINAMRDVWLDVLNEIGVKTIVRYMNIKNK